MVVFVVVAFVLDVFVVVAFVVVVFVVVAFVVVVFVMVAFVVVVYVVVAFVFDIFATALIPNFTMTVIIQKSPFPYIYKFPNFLPFVQARHCSVLVQPPL